MYEETSLEALVEKYEHDLPDRGDGNSVVYRHYNGHEMFGLESAAFWYLIEGYLKYTGKIEEADFVIQRFTENFKLNPPVKAKSLTGGPNKFGNKEVIVTNTEIEANKEIFSQII